MILLPWHPRSRF